MELTKQEIEEQANIFGVTIEFASKVAKQSNNIKEFQRVLYENQEIKNRQNIPDYIVEDLQLKKLEIEQSEGVELDVKNTIAVKLPDDNHKCIFTDMEEKPCEYCPLNAQNRMGLVLSYLSENEIYPEEEIIQELYKNMGNYFLENKEKVIMEVKEMIRKDKDSKD